MGGKRNSSTFKVFQGAYEPCVSKKKTWRMTESEACNVALFTFLLSCNGGSIAPRRLRYKRTTKARASGQS